MKMLMFLKILKPLRMTMLKYSKKFSIIIQSHRWKIILNYLSILPTFLAKTLNHVEFMSVNTTKESFWSFLIRSNVWKEFFVATEYEWRELRKYLYIDKNKQNRNRTNFLFEHLLKCFLSLLRENCVHFTIVFVKETLNNYNSFIPEQLQLFITWLKYIATRYHL